MRRAFGLVVILLVFGAVLVAAPAAVAQPRGPESVSLTNASATNAISVSASGCGWNVAGVPVDAGGSNTIDLDSACVGWTLTGVDPLGAGNPGSCVVEALQPGGNWGDNGASILGINPEDAPTLEFRSGACVPDDFLVTNASSTNGIRVSYSGCGYGPTSVSVPASGSNTVVLQTECTAWTLTGVDQLDAGTPGSCVVEALQPGGGWADNGNSMTGIDPNENTGPYEFRTGACLAEPGFVTNASATNAVSVSASGCGWNVAGVPVVAGGSTTIALDHACTAWTLTGVDPLGVGVPGSCVVEALQPGGGWGDNGNSAVGIDPHTDPGPVEFRTGICVGADGITDDLGPGDGTFADGAGTTGALVSTGGLTLLIEDAPDPAGVRIVASGVGGPAVVEACGATMSFGAGLDAVVSCGSVIVTVVTGEIVVSLGGDDNVQVPAGGSAKISESEDGVHSIENTGPTEIVVNLGGESSAVGAGESATSLPTSLRDCWRGGWRFYGIFGDYWACFRFVLTGSQEPPRWWGWLVGSQSYRSFPF